MFFSDKGYQCTMNTNALSHQLSWSYGDIYNITKSKSMFSPSWGAYILRMSVFYCNSESNLMATYTKSKSCSLVIKDTNALWIPMNAFITPVILKLWWHIQHDKVKTYVQPLVEVHTYWCLCFIVTLSPTLWPMHYEYQCIITPVILKLWWHIQHYKVKIYVQP